MTYAKIAVALTLAISSGIVHAQSQVPEICHSLYQDFTQALSLESAGTMAFEMMQENCWPSLQNSVVPQPVEGEQNDDKGYVAPPSVMAQESCEELAPEIVNIPGSDGNKLLKIHSIQSLTKSHCDTYLSRIAKTEISIEWALEMVTAFRQDYPKIYRACADVVHGGDEGSNVSDAVEKKLQNFFKQEQNQVSTLISSCSGQAIWSYGNEGDIFFYWEEFSDGDGFIGWSSFL